MGLYICSDAGGSSFLLPLRSEKVYSKFVCVKRWVINMINEYLGRFMRMAVNNKLCTNRFHKGQGLFQQIYKQFLAWMGNLIHYVLSIRNNRWCSAQFLCRFETIFVIFGSFDKMCHWRIKGNPRDAHPSLLVPLFPSFIFMQFLAKILPNHTAGFYPKLDPLPDVDTVISWMSHKWRCTVTDPELPR